MNVEHYMTRNPRTCFESENLETAARIMWEHDCGCVPIVDGASRLVGIITDRDTCMAAYTQGAPLHAIRLSTAMAKQVFSCGPKDTIEAAVRTMGTQRVRRIPVVDGQRRVVGILSLGDVARRASKAADRSSIGATLASISEPQTQPDSLLAAQPGLASRRASKSNAARAARPKAKASRRSR